MSENTERGARREILEILDRLDAIEARLERVVQWTPAPPTEFVIADYGKDATPTEKPRPS